MERLIGEACAQPQRFFMFDPPARQRLSTAFPYAVVYVEKAEGVWIVAVMYMKRRPGYWRRRLEAE
jgi:hypothetical protein